MDIFGNTVGKGVIIKYDAEGIDVRSVVSIDGIDFASLYVVDFKVFAAERFSVLPCFENKNYIFAYGHDLGQSRSQVTLLAFFGSSNCKPGDNTASVTSLVGWYDSNRLCKNGTKVAISILSDSRYSTGYLISMSINSYNADLNAATVTFTFLATDS